MLGIGGGVIVTPLLLEMGEPPSVASLTSVAIICFTSFANIIHALATHELRFDYSLTIGACVLLSSLLGLSMIARYVKRSGKQSLLVNIFIAVTFLALGLIVFAAATAVVR